MLGLMQSDAVSRAAPERQRPKSRKFIASEKVRKNLIFSLESVIQTTKMSIILVKMRLITYMHQCLSNEDCIP